MDCFLSTTGKKSGVGPRKERSGREGQEVIDIFPVLHYVAVRRNSTSHIIL
jgi:hypothetical protein